VASLQSRGELARSAGGSHVLSHQSDGGTNRTAAVGAQSDGTGEEGGGFVALAVLEGRLKEKEEEANSKTDAVPLKDDPEYSKFFKVSVVVVQAEFHSMSAYKSYRFLIKYTFRSHRR